LTMGEGSKNDTISTDGCDSLTPSQRNLREKLALLLESRNIPDPT